MHFRPVATAKITVLIFLWDFEVIAIKFQNNFFVAGLRRGGPY